MINPSRYRKLNTKEIVNGPIIYWMNREIRTHSNWSLLFAQELAIKNNQQLLVVYNLVSDFLSKSNSKRLTFKVEGLQEVEVNLNTKNIPFFLISDSDGTLSADKIVKFCKQKKAGALVTDFYPLKLPQQWSKDVAENISCAFFEVDSHNIVPAWIVSEKQEYAAYTIRPKIYRNLETYCTSFPQLKKMNKIEEKVPATKWESILPILERDHYDWIKSGERSGRKSVKDFILERLDGYADRRNDAGVKFQSDLSPYLHYGMVSVQEIAISICNSVQKPIISLMSESRNKAKVDPKSTLTLEDHAGAFLEEIIIRKELSDNFCLYQKHYDSSRSFPKWSQESLLEHLSDEREYLYNLTDFESAETHDELWNAAQNQMMQTGKMHGYMRMYWAKKILQWTTDPDTAMKIAIYLNDTYELDGRDPNGYSGIAWSIGGVHDRPWFNRNIFGKIRYMARSGCDKKFNTEEYIERWSNRQQKLL